jgi:hypothetical protein
LSEAAWFPPTRRFLLFGAFVMRTGMLFAACCRSTMAYSRRLTRKRTPLSAEFMYVLVVLAAGVMTAYWAGHQIGMDLSGIETVASLLGVDETAASPPDVGYTQAQAPYCGTGQQPAFLNGMATLKQQVGSTMGAPIECEHVSSPEGNTEQQTSTGLAAYTRSTYTVSFTDGYRHWALTPGGPITWEGDAGPPAAAS